jgi:hypothetical protein
MFPFIAIGAVLASIGILVVATLPFWLEKRWDGRITMNHDDIEPENTYTLEVDLCPTPECTGPIPLHASNIKANKNGSVTITNVPQDLLFGHWYRVRLFDPTTAHLLGQSAVQPVPAPTSFSWPRAGILAILPLVAVLAYAGLERLVSMPRALEPPTAAPAQPAPKRVAPAVTPLPASSEPMVCRVLVFDASTRLPIPDARFWSASQNGFLRSDKAGDPGAFIVTGVRGDVVEVRAPGHASQRLRLDAESVEVALPVQKSEVRVRVVGGRSGGALGHIPIRVRRGDALLLSGNSDERGEFLVEMRLEAEDLVETALDTDGFVDGRARFQQSPDGRQLELRVYYHYEPKESTKRRDEEVAQRSNSFLEACQPRGPFLATMVRTVDDALAELIEDHAGWGPLLLPGPLPPGRWHERLLAERAELIAEAEALVRDRAMLTALANLAIPLGATLEPSQTAPLEEWVVSDLATLGAAANEHLVKLRDALTRAATLFPPARLPLLRQWVRMASKGLEQPARDRVTRVIELYRAHEMLGVLRVLVRDEKWIARLRV